MRRHLGRFLLLFAALLVARMGGIMAPRRAAATASGCTAFPNSVPDGETNPPSCVVRGSAICYQCAHHITGESEFLLCAEQADPADQSICVDSPDIPSNWGDPNGDGGDDGGGDDGGGDDGGGDDGGGDDGGGGDGGGPQADSAGHGPAFVPPL